MHQLPKLPYDYDALEPHIDARTMEIHHTKHHQGYVDKLNKALEGHDDLMSKSIEDLLENINDVPESIRQAVINNGGGHANHSLFWEILGPADEAEMTPHGDLLEAINNTFGSFEDFKEAFSTKAANVFGSGWVFLIVDGSGKLSIKRHSFQNSPLMSGNTGILGLDVWEHAYYLKYQNKRADYIEAWWNVVNWDKVSELYTAASS
jgi:Fe-Mn family superoxide dismutase